MADPTQAPVGTYYARYENPGCTGPVSQPITISGCLTPFECENGVAYQVAAAGGETVSTLYAYNVTSGTRTQIAPLSILVNSLVYSEIDNTLWATKNGTNSIVRIAADGALIEYPIANLSGNFNVGTGLPGGYMLVYNTSQPRYYVVDINPARATYLRLVDPANGYALQTGPTYGIALSAAINVADLVYEPVTGLVYGVESASARLVTLNHVTGASTVGAVVAGLPTGTLPSGLCLQTQAANSTHLPTIPAHSTALTLPRQHPRSFRPASRRIATTAPAARTPSWKTCPSIARMVSPTRWPPLQENLFLHSTHTM